MSSVQCPVSSVVGCVILWAFGYWLLVISVMVDCKPYMDQGDQGILSDESDLVLV